jgi:hypothetical protein
MHGNRQQIQKNEDRKGQTEDILSRVEKVIGSAGRSS